MVSQGRLVVENQTGSETDDKSKAFNSSRASSNFDIIVHHQHTVNHVDDSIRAVYVRSEDWYFFSAPFKIVFYENSIG